MRMFGPKQCSEVEELSPSTAEDVLYSLCFRSAGSGAKQCTYFEGKISMSELCTVTSEAQSSKVWPKLELESSRHAKPRAGAPLWSKISSGSADLELNLERELRFGAKPRAGALIWSQTSSGSSVLEQNLEREPKPQAGAPLKCKTSSGSAFEVQNLKREHMFGAKH